MLANLNEHNNFISDFGREEDAEETGRDQLINGALLFGKIVASLLMSRNDGVMVSKFRVINVSFAESGKLDQSIFEVPWFYRGEGESIANTLGCEGRV